ncbi:MAG TPA: hypothetical protein VEQ85_05300 [Lacipirellulaceae bacterium]|nr:hypothetical protein [Lacipirellulaceae bacterium]
MSQGDFDGATPTVLTKKSAWNIYTTMLLVALLALLMAMFFFYMEIRTYGGFGAYTGALRALDGPAAAMAPALA